jgi:glycosyltransferase involved in cell wall biosynthesis
VKDDYRYPNLKFEIDELIASLKLEGIVRYLGLIDKAKQIALINGSKALIQASLIEGGPGASGIAEAAALDVPIIATKIMPNIEMNCGRFMYFSVDDVEALAEAMFKTYSSQKNQRFPIAKEEVEVLKLSCGIQLIRMLTSIL